ncbi:MAG: thioredoxin domain-containing protein, partial [Methylocella sp.]
MRSTKIGQAALRGRRGVFEMAAAAILTIAGYFAVLGVFASPVLAQGAGVASDELMAGEALPDIALGAREAPVTIVEYASMTCAHCAGFYAATFPILKSKYIDTG